MNLSFPQKSNICRWFSLVYVWICHLLACRSENLKPNWLPFPNLTQKQLLQLLCWWHSCTHCPKNTQKYIILNRKIIWSHFFLEVCCHENLIICWCKLNVKNFIILLNLKRKLSLSLLQLHEISEQLYYRCTLEYRVTSYTLYLTHSLQMYLICKKCYIP